MDILPYSKYLEEVKEDLSHVTVKIPKENTRNISSMLISTRKGGVCADILYHIQNILRK